MSNLTLDGSTSFIGNEFIKLLATGSSNLATEEYVDDKVAEGGGGNVDLSNYYTQTETNNLLNNKLNVNNPQDITGNLRLDPTNGLSKIILNATSPPNNNDDFYCNGSGHFNGTLRVSLLTSDGDVNCDGVNADIFNSNIITNDIVFKHNDVEYMRFNATNDTIDLSKELNLGSSALKINSITTNGLNDMTFGVDTLGEFLRLNISDSTVRVPDNRSFLAQNIFTDIIKPVAFANDVVFNGGNSTNDAYEEYMRMDASTERVNFSKNIDTSENIYMNLNKRLYLNDTVGSERYIGSSIRTGTPTFNQLDIVNENSSNGRIRLMIDTEENVIVENSQLYSRRVITANAGVNSNTYNSNGDNAVNLQQNGNTFIALQGSTTNRVQVNRLLRVVDSGNSTQCHFVQSTNGNYMSFTLGNHISTYASGGANGNTLHLNYYSHGNVFLGTNQDTTPDPKPTITINKFSSDTGNAFEVQGDSQFSGDIVIDTGKSVKTNTINSNGDNDLVFQRNDNEFLRLDKTNDNITCSKEIVAGGGIKCNTSDSDGDSNVIFKRFDTSLITLNSSNQVQLSGDLSLPTSNTQYIRFPNCNIRQGLATVVYFDFNVDTATGQYRFFIDSNTILHLRPETTTISNKLQVNTINSEGDNDLVFQRNGVEYFRLDDLTGTDILNVANDKGVSASYVFGNRFWNRSFSSDTTFFGSNVAGDDRVEYMRWNYLSQSVDYNAPIDNTGISIIGNLIDTTVSDERLKTNIKDVDTDFTSCIKNVKVKTFKYKDDKYKTNDTYGFIAQELKEHLPKECKNIVKENKVRNEDETFLSINYMKLSIVLWKCCQEQQSKIEHLEASIYEMMEDIKELKGKKTTKPKAKAKSKTKAEK